MWNNNTSQSWHAIFVSTGQEEKAKKALKTTFGDEMKFLVPKRELRERKKGKWHKVKRKLFPGYVLLKGNITTDRYYRMKQIPMLTKLLRDEDGALKIDEKELKLLKILIDNEDGDIGISTAYKENDKVKVTSGPLVGLEGSIESIDKRKGRAKVRIDFLGQTRIVQLGIQLVDKI